MTGSNDREFLRKVAEAYRQVGEPDPGARSRVVSAIRREAERPFTRSWWRRLRSVGWPAPALAAFLLLAGGALGWALRSLWLEPPRGEELANLSRTSEVRLVQFVISAPGASRVAVVGDFNDWDAEATPMKSRGEGAWTAAIPLAPGRHVYAFVVDGDRWLPDPSAPLAPEDGFGTQNSVIVVGGAES
jgi:hypothetical protein